MSEQWYVMLNYCTNSMLENETVSPLLPTHSSTQLLVGGILVLLAGGILGFYIGQYLSNSAQSDAAQADTAAEQSQCSQNLESTQKKLQYCYSDRAEIGVTTSEPYSFQTFGIYSPLLEGLTVDVTEFEYKEQVITQKVARIVAADGTENTVEVWSGNSIGGGEYFNAEYPNFPTFGGYENVGNPIYIEDIVAGWDKQTYTSPSSNIFHYSYEYSGDGSTFVVMDLISTYSPLARPMLVRIYQPMNTVRYVDARDHETPAILEAKTKLRTLADTFEIKL